MSTDSSSAGLIVRDFLAMRSHSPPLLLLVLSTVFPLENRTDPVNGNSSGSHGRWCVIVMRSEPRSKSRGRS